MDVDKPLGRIDCEVEGHHAVVTFNNPTRHNAMSLTMWGQLTTTMSKLANNNDIRVVTLRGEGNQAFVSGADISEFDENRSSEVQAAEYAEVCAAADRAVSEFPKPTIAVIQGYCFGGGLGLALACDMRICSDDAIFNMPAAKLGLGYGYRDSIRLLRLLGQSKANEMFYTARRYDAEEALEIGLVNKVTLIDELETNVTDWVESISINAPLTLAAFKACAVDWAQKDELPINKTVQNSIDSCYSSDDYKQATLAFREKRKPVFYGR